MNLRPQTGRGFLKSILTLAGILFFAVQGTAGVSSFYKWKDEQGKVHFTDDPLKIPPSHRSPARVEKKRGLPPPKWEPADTQAPPEKETVKEAPKKKVGKGERLAMRDALSFLKSDIQRYKKYDDYVPAVRHARLLKNDIVAALPAKEALGKKLEQYDSALLNEIKDFLKKSLLQDYQAKDLWPRRRGFVVERSRLAGEIPEKKRLIEKLEAELSTLPENDPALKKQVISGADNENPNASPAPENREIRAGDTGKY